MKIEDQIRLVEGRDELKEVWVTLVALQKLVHETDKDMMKHRWHFIKQRLKGVEPSKQANDLQVSEIEEEEIKLPPLKMGDAFYYSNQRLRFIMVRGIDVIAMDDDKSERTIPRSRWKDIITTKQRSV